MADQSHKEGTDFNYASITGVSKSCFMQRTSTILFISHAEKQNSEELATYNQAHLRGEKMQGLFLSSDMENTKMYCFLRILD